MTPKRWALIKAIVGEALDKPAEVRGTYLNSACGLDAELRGEVEKMLAGSEESSLRSPAMDLVGKVSELAPGEMLAHYRVEAKLGEGGMGVVYRANDTSLHRRVALKVLSPELHNVPGGQLRLMREARAASALNHPNIVTVHEIGSDRGVDFISMEYVEGRSLAQLIPAKGLPVNRVLEYAIAIADGLVQAHAAGLVHRDLKPGNVMVTGEGRVKVLDFGLAKRTEAAPVSPEDPAVTEVSATASGLIVGTVSYMSPEQAQGKKVDARSDIFSFGTLLYEMLSGLRPFRRETPALTLAAILHMEPLPLPPQIPRELERIVARCLRKEPARRIQHMDDVKLALEEVRDSPGTPLLEGAPGRGDARRRWLGWGVAAALAVGLAPVAFLYFREKPPAPAVPLHFQIQAPENALIFGLSPDGRKMAFFARDRLWVHFLESGESRDLTAAEGWIPFWSPDSRFLGYVSSGKLKKIEATGGPPQTVTDLRSGSPWGGGAWSQDDVIVFADVREGLFRVPASGGVPVQITALDPARQDNAQFCPSFLPDGRHFVYVRSSPDKGKSAIYLGSVDAKPEQQSSKALVASNSQPVYAPSADPGTGYLLFVRGGTLMAQPFDNRRFEMKGQAAPIAEQVSDDIAGAAPVCFSAAANDVLLFARSAANRPQLTWFDREGRVMGTVGEPGAYADGMLTLSPDGTQVALWNSGRRSDAGTIWTLDLSRGGASIRVTFSSRRDTNAVWSPDGSHIIFSSNRDGPHNLFQKPANSVKAEEVLLKSSENKIATSWSRDGRFLLYTVVYPKQKMNTWVLPLEGDRKPVPFFITEFTERQACFSPDGHWVAYTSNESGQDEVYVRSFAMNSAGTAVEAGGKWPISNGFGYEPRWRGDGRELYYLSAGRRLMAVEIATNPAFRAGKPQPLGALTFPSGWDSAADGRRFLGLATKSEAPPSYTVVLNWQAGLKK